MTIKEFIMMSQLTDVLAAKLFAGLSWNKMLELRSEFTRAFDSYAKTHKGKLNGIDQTQMDALGAVARFDRLLRTYYYNTEKTHPKYHGLPASKAKAMIIKEYDGISRRQF